MLLFGLNLNISYAPYPSHTVERDDEEEVIISYTESIALISKNWFF
jgi:hypothetical protein